MGNVHFDPSKPTDRPVASAALELFQNEFRIYRKVVDANVFSHREIASILREHILRDFDKPFHFVEIACGDGSIARQILPGTRIVSYRGIDLAVPALQRAAVNLEGMPFPVKLDQADMVHALEDSPVTADVIWCGLSIHHLDTEAKQALMTTIRQALRPGGVFFLFEPSMFESESREEYFARIKDDLLASWTTLTKEERDHLWQHIVAHDYPETTSNWLALGKEAGFSARKSLFQAPVAYFELFRLEA